MPAICHSCRPCKIYPEDRGCSRKRVKSGAAYTSIDRAARVRENMSRTKRIETFSGTRDKASARRWTWSWTSIRALLVVISYDRAVSRLIFFSPPPQMTYEKVYVKVYADDRYESFGIEINIQTRIARNIFRIFIILEDSNFKKVKD